MGCGEQVGDRRSIGVKKGEEKDYTTGGYGAGSWEGSSAQYGDLGALYPEDFSSRNFPSKSVQILVRLNSSQEPVTG